MKFVRVAALSLVCGKVEKGPINKGKQTLDLQGPYRNI